MAWEDSYERQERFVRRVMIAAIVITVAYLLLNVIQTILYYSQKNES